MTLVRANFCVPLLIILAMAALPAMVLAQSGGYYLEISAGSTESRSEPLFPLTSRSHVTESTVSSASYTLTGGWRFNDNIAVEISYTDHGRFSDDAVLTDRLVIMELDPVTESVIANRVDARIDGDVDYELTSYGVSLLGNWPLGRRWNVFGRLGLASWKAKTDVKGEMSYRGDINHDWNVHVAFSDSSSSFYYGLGLLYRFNRSYAAKLEYQRMRVESELFNSDPRLDALTFGIRYYF